MDTNDWEANRKVWAANVQPPPHWPNGVKPISMEGSSFIGVEPNTGRLYWDGRPVQMQSKVTLRGYEQALATLATIGTLLAGIVPFGQALR